MINIIQSTSRIAPENEQSPKFSSHMKVTRKEYTIWGFIKQTPDSFM